MKTTFFSEKYLSFDNTEGKITIATGPVIISKNRQKILLHISSSTGKYQFLGGRYSDNRTFQENAITEAQEIIPQTKITLNNAKPLILFDEVERNEEREKILLIHYEASIDDEENIGKSQWFTLEEIEDLHNKNLTSSPNILICSKYFLQN